MPNLETHLLVARRNHAAREVLRTADAGKHSEWVATIAFYEAVHLVEALFAQMGMHANSHDDRLDRLKREQRFSHIYKSFRILYAASLVARYLAEGKNARRHEYKSFADYLTPREVESLLIGHHLRQVEKSVTKQLESA